MVNKQECAELKNIKYKTMLLSGNSDIVPSELRSDISNVEYILEQERVRNQHVSWNKLDKSIKGLKIQEYTNLITLRDNLSKSDKALLQTTLLGYLDKKLLQRSKDVIYDSDNAKIVDIPNLEYNSASRRFTLRRNNKSVSSNIKQLSKSKTRKRCDKIDSNNID